jgi:hypothetical protein
LLAVSKNVAFADELDVSDDVEVDYGDDELDIDDLDIEEDDLSFEDWDGSLVASDDVDTAVLFPDHPDLNLILGEPATVLASFSNLGLKTFNVTSVQAHLHSPFDFSYYIQNFSGRAVGDIVRPSSEMTLQYAFKPEFLEPVHFWLSIWVDYTDATGRAYRSNLFNNSINLIDNTPTFSIETLSAYVPLLAMIGGAYFFKQLQEAPDTITHSSSRKNTKEIQAPKLEVYRQATTSRTRRRR